MEGTDIVLMTVVLTPFDPATQQPTGAPVTVVQAPMFAKYADTAIRVGLQAVGEDLQADIIAELQATANADARVAVVDNARNAAAAVLDSLLA